MAFGIDHFVSVWLPGHSLRYDLPDLVGHHSELAAVAVRITIFGFVIEKVDPESAWMATNFADVFHNRRYSCPSVWWLHLNVGQNNHPE